MAPHKNRARLNREPSPDELEIVRWRASARGTGGDHLVAVLGWVARHTALRREA